MRVETFLRESNTFVVSQVLLTRVEYCWRESSSFCRESNIFCREPSTFSASPVLLTRVEFFNRESSTFNARRVVPSESSTFTDFNLFVSHPHGMPKPNGRAGAKMQNQNCAVREVRTRTSYVIPNICSVKIVILRAFIINEFTRVSLNNYAIVDHPLKYARKKSCKMSCCTSARLYNALNLWSTHKHAWRA